MSAYVIRGGRALRGEISVPGDKSIGHRALIASALARGDSTLGGLSGGDDLLATQRALAAMGVGFEMPDEGVLRVRGRGLYGLQMPRGLIDCGNSGTTMRLIAGLLCAQRFGTRLIGDASLSKRPMGRLIAPLRARGAHIDGTRIRHVVTSSDADEARDQHAIDQSEGAEEALCAPLSVAPLVEGESLRGLEFVSPIASAQVKGALLLSGLYASGPTLLAEPMISRDHTERMLQALGVPIHTMGPELLFNPHDPSWERGWDAVDWRIPGDLSSAAYLVAAATLLPQSHLVIEEVGVNPTRTGFLDILRLMGFYGVRQRWRGELAGAEPCADLEIEASSGRACAIDGELVLRAIDEIPVWAVLASRCQGVSEVRGARELRFKESDRLASTAAMLKGFGVPAQAREDGLQIEGGAPLHPGVVQSHGDHRIAMSATILALSIEGESRVEDVACVQTSFPGFDQRLRQLGAEIECRP